jgi:hypothetical protein
MPIRHIKRRWETSLIIDTSIRSFLSDDSTKPNAGLQLRRASASNHIEKGYLKSMLSSRQLQGFVGRRLSALRRFIAKHHRHMSPEQSKRDE